MFKKFLKTLCLFFVFCWVLVVPAGFILNQMNEQGNPYSEQTRNRIFVRGLVSRDERITLAHEFLHLGFRNHPRGQDEEFVEKMAQRLVDHRLTGE